MNFSTEINEILKGWNPICVSGSDLGMEYVRYIDEILECRKNKEDLFSLLNDIEGNRIGSFYTSEEVRRDVAEKILGLFNS